MIMTLVRSAAVVMILTGATVVAGCATQPAPRPDTLDPANPAAPESSPQTVSQVLEPQRPPSARVPSAEAGATSPSGSPTPPGSAGEVKGGEVEQAGHGHQGHGSGSPGSVPAHDPMKSEKSKPDKGEAVFTCPMHPEVISPKPGNCPKCGMKLLPKGSSGSGNLK